MGARLLYAWEEQVAVLRWRPVHSRSILRLLRPSAAEERAGAVGSGLAGSAGGSVQVAGRAGQCPGPCSQAAIQPAL